MQLYGLDCDRPNCVHDNIPAYRLRLQLRRSDICLRCSERGRQFAKLNPMAKDNADTRWRRCPKCMMEWSDGLHSERRDMIFRVNQRDSALSYMAVLGHPSPSEGAYAVTGHPSIPPGFTERIFILTAEKMPKSALYFRMKPGVDEELEPDKVFQCVFPPNATAAERRNAPQIELSVAQLKALLKYNDGKLVQSYADIKCHHCQQHIPLKSFSTLGLREIALGD